MSHLRNDIRYALRLLLKTPGVTSLAIASLALGIGANTAIFSLIDVLILRPLPVRHPEQLVALSTLIADDQNGSEAFSLPMFEELRRQKIFAQLFAWSGGGMETFDANGVRYPGSLDTVSGEYFSTMGVPPLLGRLITPGDVALDAGTSSAIAVITYPCWQRRYHGDPAVVGKTIQIDGRQLTIIGVTPENFAGLRIDKTPEATVPIGWSGQPIVRTPKLVWLNLFARLKPGQTLDHARAQLTALWPRIQQVTLPREYNGSKRARFFSRRIDIKSATTGSSSMRERFSRSLALLIALTGSVLLIACVNLANLMLARAGVRQHEIGIRIALGAGAWRLIRQLLAESILLSCTGATLGLALAFWAARLLVNTMWTGYGAAAFDPSPDLRVLAFTTGLALITGVLFGLAPTWRMIRAVRRSALQQNSRTMHRGLGPLGRLLISGQIAFSLVLVLGALLLVRSLERIRSADTGFRRDGVLTMQLFPQPGREKIPSRTAYYHQLADRLSRLPGVRSVSYSNMGPVSDYEFKQQVSLTSSPAVAQQAVADWVGPGFFRLIGMRVLAGREFDWTDDERKPRLAIVSESLATRLFPNRNPIGQKIDVGLNLDGKGAEIIGVVNSASLWKPQDHSPVAVYIPLMQQPDDNTVLVDIRDAGDVSSLKVPAERTLESLGRQYSLRTQTIEERSGISLKEEHITATLSAFFGGLSLLLASIGLYGLLSYAVTRRTPELGVRMALGADRRNLTALVLREVILLVGAGLAVGLPSALAAAHLLSGMLFDVSPTDPATVACAVLLLLSVALLAAYLPARRASRIDPITALRVE